MGQVVGEDLAALMSGAASAVILAGLLLSLAAFALTRDPAASLPVFTDLLLAGGLLRLAAGDRSWALATVGALVVVRMAIVRSLRRDLRLAS